RQGEPNGTAAAAQAGLAQLNAGESALVVDGDVWFDPADLIRLLAAHTAANAAPAAHVDSDENIATVLLAPLGDERPQDWLCAELEGNLVRGFLGHPRGGRHRYAGLALLEPAAHELLAHNPGIGLQVPVGGMPHLEQELLQSLQFALERGRYIQGVVTQGDLVDLDKPWHLLEANHRALARLSRSLVADQIAPGAQVAPDAEIQGHAVLAPGARIGSRVVVRGNVWLGEGAELTNGAILDGDVMIGAHSRVSDYCFVSGGSVVGPRCRVLHGAEFSGVLLENVYLYHYMEISGIMGRNCDLGAATVCGTLRFDDDRTRHQVGGRRETPLVGADCAYLGDFCRTGVGAILLPGAKVGPYSLIGPGVVVRGDVPGRQAVFVKQELETKPWGPERYGW
ncbi:MAG TPA: nucleotidyl transferase, partial [Limnochordia bacterium]|nr:nucleotidyl transferase [Limnochordia bacterium]